VITLSLPYYNDLKSLTGLTVDSGTWTVDGQPNGNNLAPMPEGWAEWGQEHTVYPAGLTRYLFVDTANLSPSGKASLRMEADYEGGYGHTQRDGFIREPNYWIPVRPGWHLLFKCFMKTQQAQGDVVPGFSGARLGCDFYDNQGWIGETDALDGDPTNPDWKESEAYVPWGTLSWVVRTMEFNILPTYSNTGTARVPTGIILWIQVMPWEEPGHGWFSDCEVYVTP
jgi:hypothetical protein